VPSETTIRDVVVFENTRYGSTKRALVVVTGKVLVGFDLEKATVDIDHDAKRMRITLPPASIMATDVIDMKTWKPVKSIATHGPGFFMRSHDNTPYAWVDAMMGARKDTLQVIDKRTLAVVGEVTPSPGKTAAHVEFDRYGRYALASLWETDGALIVFDAATLAEVKRIPMNKPVGKYNVANKIRRSEGTSH
jgi:hypothetical protein